MECLKNTICDGIDENPELFPIFNQASSLMFYLNDYGLRDFDDVLFESVIAEVIDYLKN